jgi:predicted NUDIX family phosphoesterase
MAIEAKEFFMQQTAPAINPKHLVHILAVSASHFEERQNGFCQYTPEVGHVIIARRHELEKSNNFRQLLPGVVLTHKGRIFAYRRTPKGGEPGLHNQVAVLIGGHWDLSDIQLDKDGVIDFERSLSTTIRREVTEEVLIHGQVINETLAPWVIAADETVVDEKHVALVSVLELSLAQVESKEDELEALGFFTADELLKSNLPLETWARLICEKMRDGELPGAGSRQAYSLPDPVDSSFHATK